MENVSLFRADGEALPFDDNSFDIVYSWGVLHHSPDTEKAIEEVYRVLRPGGRSCIMIYHNPSIVGIALWFQYALFRGRPFQRLRDIYANYLESPGTKAYSRREAAILFRQFSSVEMHVDLTHGDLLEGDVGQRHQSRLLQVARKVWPREMLRRFGGALGLNLVVLARK